MRTSDSPPRGPGGRPVPAGHRGRDMERFGRISVELLHDMGSVLALLSARIDVVQNEARLGRHTGTELAAVQSDADELRRMVVEVLDELRGTHPAHGPGFDIRAELERTIDRWYLSGTGTPLRLRCTLPPEARVAGPRTIFTRAAANLLRNAGRHARSRVVVSLAPSADGTGAVLTVEDDGPGIPDGFRDRLFQPFESMTPGGHGLGLSFSMWATERLGGALRCEGPSTELGGACFRMHLPLLETHRSVDIRRSWHGGTDPDPRQARRDSIARPLSTRTLRVAVVDDDRAVGDVFARRLSRSGFEARSVPVLPSHTLDSVAALVLGAADRPDVVLVDLNLGIGSGLDLATAIESGARASGLPSPFIVMMTGGERISAATGFRSVHKLDAWDEICGVLNGNPPDSLHR
ncbi:MAG: hybrid sensor histidine kinase/response regulator [Gemmatimonadales bacterium]|nr:MAG: hybrid sensor histidine kinase/response regulator [Gemmatimonadales bacterium]